MQELVEPGIRCSYKDPYSVCVYGECEVSLLAYVWERVCGLLFAHGISLSLQKVGCENVVGSPLQEDKCGVCGGDGTRCKTHRFNFTFTDKKGRA